MGYLDLVGQFVYKTFLARAKLDGLGENDQFLKDNGWQDGTKMLFYQATVPTGWTQDVSVNNRFFRVVSGVGAGTGGSASPSANMPTSHVHSLPFEGSHVHTLFATHTHELDFSEASEMVATGPGDVLIGTGNQIMRKAGGLGSLPRDFIGPVTRNTGNADGDVVTSDSNGDHNHGGLNSQSPGSVTFRFTDIIVGTKDVSVGYNDLTNEFNSNDKINFDPFALLESNDLFLEPRLMPFGSVSTFFQSTAPVGWTQTTPENDRLLRVVSGAGLGVGGSQSPAVAVNFSHTHGEVTPHPSHNHSFPAHVHILIERSVTNGKDPISPERFAFVEGSRMKQGDGTAVTRNAMKARVVGGPFTSANTAAGAHFIENSLGSIQVAYVDVITASKDSGGAPFPFVVLTGSVLFEKLVSKQRLDNLAKNDEYLKFHTMPSGNKTFFFQATAPLTWTLDTSQNDKGLRVVSSGGGVSAGSQGIGSAWPLNHTHVLLNVGHGHTANHIMDVDSASQTNVGNKVTGAFGDSDVVTIGSGSPQDDLSFITATAGFNQTIRRHEPNTQDNFGHVLNTLLHTHIAGNTNPGFTFSFADVILCAKNP